MSLSIGTFDGIHIGHQALIRKMLSFKMPVAVCNLIVSPWQETSLKSIYSVEQQNQLLTGYGVDYVINQSLTEGLRDLSAENLLENIKAQFDFKVLFLEKHIHSDWKTDKINVEELAERLGVHLQIAAPFTWKGKVITSSLIKEALRMKDFESANEWLGRPYSIRGPYDQGMQLNHLYLPPEGQYEVTVDCTYDRYDTTAALQAQRITLERKPPVSSRFPIEIIFKSCWQAS